MRCHSHADFLTADRCRITLAARAPINFHVVRPGLHAIVTPKSVAQAWLRTAVEFCPLPNPRIRAIRADNPPRSNEAMAEINPVVSNAGDARPPQQFRSGLRCPLHDEIVKRSAPNRQTTAATGNNASADSLALTNRMPRNSL